MLFEISRTPILALEKIFSSAEMAQYLSCAHQLIGHQSINYGHQNQNRLLQKWKLAIFQIIAFTKGGFVQIEKILLTSYLVLLRKRESFPTQGNAKYSKNSSPDNL
jgi:hypothetical protein